MVIEIIQAVTDPGDRGPALINHSADLWPSPPRCTSHLGIQQACRALTCRAVLLTSESRRVTGIAGNSESEDMRVAADATNRMRAAPSRQLGADRDATASEPDHCL